MVGNRVILKGNPASPGLAEGKAVVILDPTEQGKIIDKGILVAPFITPLLLPVLIKSAGIVTDKGGVMCHAAIIAREFGIPCVTGTEEATKKIENGAEVIVDGTKGYIYQK